MAVNLERELRKAQRNLREARDEVEGLTKEVTAEKEVRNAIARHSERQDQEIERLTTEITELKAGAERAWQYIESVFGVPRDRGKTLAGALSVLNARLSKEAVANNATVQSLTAEVSRLRAALSNLVYVKDWKDKYGKDETYRVLQPASWEAARKALLKNPDSGRQNPQEGVFGSGLMDSPEDKKPGTSADSKQECHACIGFDGEHTCSEYAEFLKMKRARDEKGQ